VRRVDLNELLEDLPGQLLILLWGALLRTELERCELCGDEEAQE
jgi:hypothetical protein